MSSVSPVFLAERKNCKREFKSMPFRLIGLSAEEEIRLNSEEMMSMFSLMDKHGLISLICLLMMILD